MKNERIKKEIEGYAILILCATVIALCVGMTGYKLVTNWNTSMSMIEEAMK